MRGGLLRLGFCLLFLCVERRTNGSPNGDMTRHLIYCCLALPPCAAYAAGDVPRALKAKR